MRYECPICDLTCPYCKADGECTIDGNPMDGRACVTWDSGISMLSDILKAII